VRLRRQPFPPPWLALLDPAWPYWRLLSTAEQAELAGHTQVLLHEKHFEGCGGLELTDEMRVTIAAQAALLLLERQTDYYPTLGSVLVYPERYLVEAERPLPGGVVAAGEQVRAGESWYRGALVLSWQDVQHDRAVIDDGRNIVLHEFAHQLDSESGANEGAPRLPRAAQYADWARVLGREFGQLRDDLAQHRPTVLHPYGATSPAEFFAVATEMFFERPIALRQRHRELYEQLQRYYHQDPAERMTRYLNPDR
jgi:Mlc titration factor MtfA (ptsG expression regulator)